MRLSASSFPVYKFTSTGHEKSKELVFDRIRNPVQIQSGQKIIGIHSMYLGIIREMIPEGFLGVRQVVVIKCSSCNLLGAWKE